MIFTLPETLVLLGLDFLALVLSLIALIGAVRVLKNWDFNATTPGQYRLEKGVYLTAVLILFVLALKLLLLPFFVFLLDRLSLLMPGAMCAAGVVNANGYGTPLLFIRMATAFALGTWLVIHRLDLAQKTWPFTRRKFLFFLPVFFLIALEPLLGLLFLSGLDTQEAVQCCSLLYGVAQSAGTLPLGIHATALWVIFGALGLLSVTAGLLRHEVLALAVAPAFLLTALMVIIYLFSPYVYELPTHQCPYCLLQKEYGYMGYFLYGTLLMGTFSLMAAGLSALWLKERLKRLFWAGAVFNAVFLAIVAFYPLGFYFRNGVWL